MRSPKRCSARMSLSRRPCSIDQASQQTSGYASRPRWSVIARLRWALRPSLLWRMCNPDSDSRGRGCPKVAGYATVRGSRAGCRHGARSCDARVHVAQGDGRGPVPLRECAQSRRPALPSSAGMRFHRDRHASGELCSWRRSGSNRRFGKRCAVRIARGSRRKHVQRSCPIDHPRSLWPKGRSGQDYSTTVLLSERSERSRTCRAR